MFEEAAHNSIVVDVIVRDQNVFGFAPARPNKDAIARIVQDAISDGDVLALFDVDGSGVAGIGPRLAIVVGIAVGRSGGPELQVLNGDVTGESIGGDAGTSDLDEAAFFVPCLLYTSPSPRDS